MECQSLEVPRLPWQKAVVVGLQGNPASRKNISYKENNKSTLFKHLLQFLVKWYLVGFPELTKVKFCFPARSRRISQLGRKKPKDLHLQLHGGCGQRFQFTPSLGGGGGTEIANQQENHLQGKYLPRRWKKKSQQIYQPIFQFSHPARNPCRTHILQTLLLGAPGTCLKFLEPLFLGFFYQSIINWC